jgi:hypothetical protein
MPLASFIFVIFLSQASPQSTASTAMIQAAGHTYQLFCAQQGEVIRASETGLCKKTESGGVERFEIRNEDGEAQFFQDAPAGNPFSYVGIFLFASGGRKILDVETAREEPQSGGPNPARVFYYFDPTASGLVPFSPPLMGIDGFAQLGTAMALSRTFDTGLFQFSVLLDLDLANHRIEVMPDQAAFSAFPVPGRKKSAPSPSSGELKLYGTHDSGAARTDIRILPGHTVTWWQSLPSEEKPATGQVIMILAAWAPASLKAADNAPEGVQMVNYDWNNLWLQIQVEGHTGWIRGTSSFRMIGLEMATTQH